MRTHAAVSLIQDTVQSLRRVGFVHNRAALHVSGRRTMRTPFGRIMAGANGKLPRTQLASSTLMTSKDSLGSAELVSDASLDILSPSGVDAMTKPGPPVRAAAGAAKFDQQVRASSPVQVAVGKPAEPARLGNAVARTMDRAESSKQQPFDTNLCLAFDGPVTRKRPSEVATEAQETKGGAAIATSPKRTPHPTHHDNAQGGPMRDYSTHMHHLTAPAWRSERHGDQADRSGKTSSSDEGPRRSLASLVVATLHMVLQFCGVVAMVIAAIFHTSADAAAVEDETSTAAIVGIAGASMLLLSALGHLASRISTALAWLLAIPSSASFVRVMLLVAAPSRATAALSLTSKCRCSRDSCASF